MEERQTFMTPKQADAVVLATYEPLYRYFMRRVRDQAFSEDLVQETYLRFFARGVPAVQPGKELPYLYRIAFHLLADRTRRRQMETEPFDDEQACDETFDAQAYWRKHADQQILQCWIAVLPLSLQEIIRLRYEEQMSFVQIAQILETPVTTIKSRHARALQKLARMAQEDARESEPACQGALADHGSFRTCSEPVYHTGNLPSANQDPAKKSTAGIQTNVNSLKQERRKNYE